MKSFALSEWMLSHRKIAVSFLVLAFLLLIMVRYGLFPSRTATDEIDWRTQWTGILDGLISTIVVSFVVASTLWWTKPPLERIPPGFEILPGSISNILEKSARESTEWEYVGHTARYVRNRIIPILLEQSSRNNRNVRVRMLVIDPSDNQLCQKYADYRNRSRSGHLFQNKWTKEDVQAQILVTLAKLVNLHHDSNFFSCEIRLRRFLSQFRVDASYDQLTVTQEDPQEPAYQYPRGSRCLSNKLSAEFMRRL